MKTIREKVLQILGLRDQEMIRFTNYKPLIPTLLSDN